MYYKKRREDPGESFAIEDSVPRRAVLEDEREALHHRQLHAGKPV